jgi:hypothetical protein
MEQELAVMLPKYTLLVMADIQRQVTAQQAAVSATALAVMDSPGMVQLAADMKPQTLAAELPGTDSNKRKRP